MRPTPSRRSPDLVLPGRDARVTIVGAGPAGLALARELQRRGVRPMLLERGRVGETWAAQYHGLRLHVLAGAAALPGCRGRARATASPARW